ncbi:MAG: hypothetical protein KC466_14425, partial [Myxococcales bacterium]|nr:hypothetical protein [Myxococcales bacterium]
RRGKQFNSMIQAERDALTGLRREDVLISAEDMERLELAEGTWVSLASEHGAMRARVVAGPILPGNLQVHWPEGNVLLPHGRREPLSGIPDYNVLVRVDRA